MQHLVSNLHSGGVYPGAASSTHLQEGKKDQLQLFPLPTLTRLGQIELSGPQRLHQFEVFWFRSGNHSLTVDSRSFRVEGASIYCLGPGQVRSVVLPADAQGYYLSFSPDFLLVGGTDNRLVKWLDPDRLVDRIPVGQTSSEAQLEIEAIIGNMERELAGQQPLRTEILWGLLNVLLVHASRCIRDGVGASAEDKDAVLVRRFRGLLRKNYASCKMVAEYAGELAVTPNYLTRIVRKITGYSASYQIQQFVILEAKRQAVHTNGTMKEIAYQLGFDSPSHFSRFFKSKSGMNFTCFRKALDKA